MRWWSLLQGRWLLAGLCALSALSVWLLLSQMAAPHDRGARVRAAATRLDAAGRLAKVRGDANGYRPSPICEQDPVTASEQLIARIGSAATGAGLTVESVSPVQAERLEEGGFWRVGAGARLTGRYDGVLAFLVSLDNGAPEVFLDAGRLRRADSNSAQADLELAAFVLCR